MAMRKTTDEVTELGQPEAAMITSEPPAAKSRILVGLLVCAAVVLLSATGGFGLGWGLHARPAVEIGKVTGDEASGSIRDVGFQVMVRAGWAALRIGDSEVSSANCTAGPSSTVPCTMCWRKGRARVCARGSTPGDAEVSYEVQDASGAWRAVACGGECEEFASLSMHPVEVLAAVSVLSARLNATKEYEGLGSAAYVERLRIGIARTVEAATAPSGEKAGTRRMERQGKCSWFSNFHCQWCCFKFPCPNCCWLFL
jgi:hypothetical protein